MLSFTLPTKLLSLALYNVANNQTHCVIVTVIADYDYIQNAIDYDYDYTVSRNGDYDYQKSSNRLQSITITDYDYPNPRTSIHANLAPDKPTTYL